MIGSEHDVDIDWTTACAAQYIYPRSRKLCMVAIYQLFALQAWLDRGHKLHTFEAKLGGNVELSVTMPDANQDSREYHFGGKILVFAPLQEMTLQSQWHDADVAWPVPTYWTLCLIPVYDGTLVELLHHGFEQLGKAAARNLQDYESAWDIKHLSALRDIVEQTA